MIVYTTGAALLPLVSRVLVALGWVAFSLFFLLRRRNSVRAEAKRDPVSQIGIVLQMVGFGLVWLFQRPLPLQGTPLGIAEIVLDLIAPVLSIVSAWIGLTAVHTLGQQWSLTARLIEGHELAIRGPYRWVRHPIYTGMLGKLLASNFAFGHWVGLVVAGSVFLAGTLIRIGSEEKLLRAEFGPAYEQYAGRVRALIPGIV